jgi:TorA maturation chaperone TorD
MEARIRNDSLENDFKNIAQRHNLLRAKAETSPRQEWKMDAKRIKDELTMMLRTVNTKTPLGSAERLFLGDAKKAVLSYLSYWDLKLRR